MIIGLVIIVIISIFIFLLRKTIQASNNNTLKNVIKVGDFFIWGRFILFLIITGIILIFVNKNKLKIN